MTHQLQTFSLELCQHLTSLVPEFEGHYKHTRETREDRTGGYYTEHHIRCVDFKEHLEFENHTKDWEIEYICPAWQVEDVLRNLMLILEKIEKVGYPSCFRCMQEIFKCLCDKKIELWLRPYHELIAFRIYWFLYTYQYINNRDAYFKIEGYLWEILK